MSIDGENTLNFLKSMFYWPVTEIKVIPGKHDIRFKYKMEFGVSIAELWVVTCPGKSYFAKAVAAGAGSLIWIEDEETGKRVGGIKGSVDEPKDKNVPCDGEKRL